jgi:branched-chain amino acid transport system permease protein
VRGIGLVFIALVSIALSACGAMVDTEPLRLCRSILPALHDVGAGFEIVDAYSLAASGAASPVVAIRYRSAADRRERTLTCSFSVAAQGGQPRLVSLANGFRAFGPERVHLLQKHWIDSGRAAQSDPAPIAMAPLVMPLPRVLAISLQHAVSALPAIAIYALLATAYSLIYGLTGRINLAFGDLASLAGYGAFLGFSLIGGLHPVWAVLLALVFGLFTAALHGGALGQAVLTRIVHAPGQHILIATIGMSIVWQEAMRLTQGAGNRWLSPLMNRPLGIARAGDFVVTVTPIALIVAGVAALVAVVMVQGMRKSRFGLVWRASADDPVAAAMMGVDQNRTLVQTVMLAAALSGLCGVLTTLFYGGVGYAGGLITGLKALIAAIIGGIGSIPGALVGGLLLGIAETAWAGFFQIEYREPAIFIGLAVVLWLRPGGLFGTTDWPAKNQR